VRDNGVGIPEHLQSRIFERFFRGGQWGQHGTEHVSGSGLGLSLVKAIVESHKGRVWVESEEGKGAAFYLAIPGISEPRNISYSQ
jgi:signal transduction histidine kinase